MRLIALVIFSFLLSLGGAGGASAGILDIFDDPITKHPDCSYAPCMTNNLIWKKRYQTAPYYRFKLRKVPAEVGFTRVRIKVLPPLIAVSGGAEIDWLDKRAHVVAGTSRYRVVAPARYEWVTRRVFYHPPRYRVVRVSPTHALIRDKIVIVDPACKLAVPGGPCRY